MSKEPEEPVEEAPDEDKKRTPAETARELGKELKRVAAEDPLNQARRRKS